MTGKGGWGFCEPDQSWVPELLSCVGIQFPGILKTGSREELVQLQHYGSVGPELETGRKKIRASKRFALILNQQSKQPTKEKRYRNTLVLSEFLTSNYESSWMFKSETLRQLGLVIRTYNSSLRWQSQEAQEFTLISANRQRERKSGKQSQKSLNLEDVLHSRENKLRGFKLHLGSWEEMHPKACFASRQIPAS